jgi:hypothetical protein
MAGRLLTWRCRANPDPYRSRATFDVIRYIASAFLVRSLGGDVVAIGEWRDQ